MKPQHHAAASIIVSGILFMIFKSWGMALGCLAAGIFIDVDYLIDYLIQYGFPITVKKFHQAYNENLLIKVRLFHSWEWLLILGVAAWLANWNVLIIGILIGVGQHLLLDKVNHGERFRCYSLIWRWKKRFKAEDIFKRKHG